MKVIFIGMEYEDYNPKRGHTDEYAHFYSTISQLPGVEAVFLRLDDVPAIGRKEFDRRLKVLVDKNPPDVIFSYMFSDDINKKLIAEFSKSIVTIAFFADDHWRFDNFSKYYAKCFRYVCTTYAGAVPRYKKLGANVIKTQWAADTTIFHPAFSKFPRHNFVADVSFVGQYHPQRARIIDAIRRAGVSIVVKGHGWPEAPQRISQEAMVRYFSLSKISLNLNPSSVAFTPRAFARLFLKRTGSRVETDFLNFFNNIKMWHDKRIPQIKERMFDIPAAGGFLITGEAADKISDYYVPDKEIVVYEGIPDLIEKIKYYLAHEKEREQIAQNGYERTIREHTYPLRMRKIFEQAGFPIE